MLSHAHHDHIGGARHLLGKFPVGEVWDAGLHQDLPSYRGLLDEIERALGMSAVPFTMISSQRASPLNAFWPKSGVNRTWSGTGQRRGR